MIKTLITFTKDVNNSDYARGFLFGFGLRLLMWNIEKREAVVELPLNQETDLRGKLEKHPAIERVILL